MTMIVKDISRAEAAMTRRERLAEELRARKERGIKFRWEDFSFDQCREFTKDYPGSISDILREERDAS